MYIKLKFYTYIVPIYTEVIVFQSRILIPSFFSGYTVNACSRISFSHDFNPSHIAYIIFNMHINGLPKSVRAIFYYIKMPLLGGVCAVITSRWFAGNLSRVRMVHGSCVAPGILDRVEERLKAFIITIDQNMQLRCTNFN